MVIAVLFLAATVAYFLTADYAHTESLKLVRLHNNLSWVRQAQVIPSSIALCMGALLFWLCVTAFLGRFYCSTVCPIGTVSDIFMRLRRELAKLFPRRVVAGKRAGIGFRPGFRWKEPYKGRYHIMALYYICLVIGIVAVPFVMEPWNIVRNVASSFDPQAVATTWSVLGVGVAVGIAAGGVMLLVVVVWGFFCGRDFCNIVCPLGQTMAIFDRFQLTHIEFDPDRCISCMRCEEVCRSSCIRVKDRIVDNSRCVRCLDCICACPNNAIRLQGNRNRAATPMMMSNGR